MKTIISKLNCIKIIGCVMISSIFFSITIFSYAEEETKLMQTISVGDSIYFYISNLDSYTEATAQIGRETVDIVGFDASIAGRTVFLLDNSRSVSEKNLDKIKQIIDEYVQKKLPDEMISIATFGENVEGYYVVDEVDASLISEALNDISVDDKETFLTDALYDELLKYSDAEIYTRFVIVSDGVDNKAIGYTKEELTDYLRDNEFPIFSIGCKHNNNDESLKNMFAISRFTKANFYLLDEYESYEEIVSGLTEPVSCARVIVPECLRDGSTQSVLLTFRTQNGDIEVKDEVSMPFEAKKEKQVIEESNEDPMDQLPVESISVSAEIQDEIEQGDYVEKTPDVESGSIDFVTVVGIILIVIGGLALLIISIVKKKSSKKNAGEKGDVGNVMNVPVNNNIGWVQNPVIGTSNDNRTVFYAEEPDEGKTVYLGRTNNADYKVLVVKDVNNSGKVFRYPLRGRVIIGRKKDNDVFSDVNIVINYDPSVSGRHLAVSMQGDRLYIEDLNSSNGTFINGQRISGIIPVSAGCEIEIGTVHIILDVE